jgi:hypothetical protein
MTQAASVTAALLIIGDEILSGRTKDENIGSHQDWDRPARGAGGSRRRGPSPRLNSAASQWLNTLRSFSIHRPALAP